MGTQHPALTLPLSVAILAAACASAPTAPDTGVSPLTQDPPALNYPQAERLDIVDVHHGVAVDDPYRWLEDPADPRTLAWVKAQNELTQGWLAQSPRRADIRARLTELWAYPRYLSPHAAGGMLYFLKNDGLQAQSTLYRVPEGGGEPEVVLDPNTFSPDGTVALGEDLEFSPDGRYLAYGVSDGGSDWTTIKIRDLSTLEDLPDTLEWTKFRGPAWLPDSSGLVYSRYPQPDNPLEAMSLGNALHLHRLGTPQGDDPLILANPDEPTWFFDPRLSSDKRHIIIEVTRSTEERNLIYTLPTDDLHAEATLIIGAWDYHYRYLASQGERFYLWTDHNAPRGRIVAVEAGESSPEAFDEIVPEGSGTIEGAVAAGGGFAVRYLDDAHSALRFFATDGSPRGEATLPGLGTIDELQASWDSPVVYARYSSYTTPPLILAHSLSSGETTTFRRSPAKADLSGYVTSQVFYTSKDGTRVPMFLTHRDDVEPTGDVPTLLYGYGGFNIAITPGFSVANLVFMEMGGVYAVANLRGGGEYGREWHEAGTLTHKQNVFDDFIAAAEYLIDAGWTKPKKLAIHGRSNGGLLVGATMLQRPDLFGAAIPGVGVMDMLRYHLFTIGYAWASDYGTVDDAQQFEALMAYSPVHNVTEGTAYPATLVTTAARDDRVVPAHSFKFAAALQHGQGGKEPALIRVETRAGHGAGKPTAMKIDEATDILTFLTLALGME